MPISPLSPTALQQAVFQGQDKNKSGKLEGKEFEQALAAITGKPSVSTTEVQEALTALDTSGDGAVDLQEFVNANVTASQSGNSSNLYAALQTAGVASSNADSNLYTSLISGSLSGSLNQTGALVGQVVAGSVLNKLV